MVRGEREREGKERGGRGEGRRERRERRRREGDRREGKGSKRREEGSERGRRGRKTIVKEACDYIIHSHMSCIHQESVQHDAKEHFVKTLRHGGRSSI